MKQVNTVLVIAQLGADMMKMVFGEKEVKPSLV
jgi:hypothetical protein